ncbi:hypothetical protein F7734_20020 [Scytonema sp. UIC 10036]|uniref:hypothetical protein n=1 Tax=Scytonema sp. UIC 10036 TaxID=2304196 RepID=UPI0012DAF303|nr:hypothetical protein [Scytonema sp. UIC 10036]MUG94538.1 hypothetical protein [Scytonema sp. UIC 10036]
MSLGFGLGLTYTGEVDARLPNTFEIPSYLKVDAILQGLREIVGWENPCAKPNKCR